MSLVTSAATAKTVLEWAVKERGCVRSTNRSRSQCIPCSRALGTVFRLGAGPAGGRLGQFSGRGGVHEPEDCAVVCQTEPRLVETPGSG